MPINSIQNVLHWPLQVNKNELFDAFEKKLEISSLTNRVLDYRNLLRKQEFVMNIVICGKID